VKLHVAEFLFGDSVTGTVGNLHVAVSQFPLRRRLPAFAIECPMIQLLPVEQDDGVGRRIHRQRAGRHLARNRARDVVDFPLLLGNDRRVRIADRLIPSAGVPFLFLCLRHKEYGGSRHHAENEEFPLHKALTLSRNQVIGRGVRSLGEANVLFSRTCVRRGGSVLVGAVETLAVPVAGQGRCARDVAWADGGDSGRLTAGGASHLRYRDGGVAVLRKGRFAGGRVSLMGWSVVPDRRCARPLFVLAAVLLAPAAARLIGRPDEPRMFDLLAGWDRGLGWMIAAALALQLAVITLGNYRFALAASLLFGAIFAARRLTWRRRTATPKPRFAALVFGALIWAFEVDPARWQQNARKQAIWIELLSPLFCY